MNDKFIALDVHKAFSEMVVLSCTGRVTKRQRLSTAVPSLVKAINGIRRPRRLTFEEGPLAGWLSRNLRPHVDELVVCEPRRNRWIAREGDKTDPVDAEKLARLYRGGFLKAVHQPADFERSALKQLVGLYHDQVRRRVRLGHQLTAILARHGLFPDAAGLVENETWQGWLSRLPAHRQLHAALDRLREAYVGEIAHERTGQQELIGAAKNIAVVRQFNQVPGIGWIRGVTFYAEVDTPWRFSKKSALWRYAGLGLKQRQSGRGRPQTRVSPEGNRRLKNLLIGAAETCAQQGDNPFGRMFHHLWKEKEQPRSQARRTVARHLATLLWSLWKTGQAYDPQRVGQTARPVTTGRPSAGAAACPAANP